MTEPRPHPAVTLETLRRAQDRAFNKEGIPMILALVDERSGATRPPAPTSGEGAGLADRMGVAKTALLPTARDDDMGGVISVLQAVSFTDFGDHGDDDGGAT